MEEIKMPEPSKDRKNERGAALITVLMISFLLLIASATLLMESSTNTANVTDATAEQQSYYAAESGIQTVVDTLRHNPVPNPLVDASKPITDPMNEIDYLQAVQRSSSNICPKSPGTCVDPDYADAFDRSVDANGNPQPVRLSRWMTYNWGPNGGAGAINKDRIVLGDPAAYSPINGFAFSASISDPDANDGHIKYQVDNSNVINNNDTNTPGYYPSVSTAGYAITYNPPAPQDLDANTGLATGGSLGTFTITGDPTKIPKPNATPAPGGGGVRFRIIANVTQPANSSMVIRGYILPPGSSYAKSGGGNCTSAGASILFDSELFFSFGSRIRLNYTAADAANAPGCTVEETSGSADGPYNTYLSGFMVQPSSLAAPVKIPVTITQPEPTRLVVKSIGYGPRGARKELEAVIQKSYFDNLGSPSPLLLLGPKCTRADATDPTCIDVTGPVGNSAPTRFTADCNPGPGCLGNSSALAYSGKDLLLKAFLPPVGVSNDDNLKIVQDARLSGGFKGSVYGTIENVRPDIPRWLQSPVNLDQTISLLRDIAKASGTCPPSPCSYYPPGVAPPTKGVYGDFTNAAGITFVDGDANISGSGGGLLVITGQLTFGGSMDYNGLVLITGKGGFLKTGAGGGTLAGTMIVAPYDVKEWSLTTCMQSAAVPDKTNCFLAPQYQNNGGGNGEIMFSSTNVLSSLNGITNLVKGVAEK